MNREIQKTRSSRRLGQRGALIVRPDPGRGNIVSSHAAELQHHQGATQGVRQNRTPQVGRSTVDRIIMGHGGQSTQGRARIFTRRAALERVITDNSDGEATQGNVQDGGHESAVSVGNPSKFLPVSDRITIAHDGGSDGIPAAPPGADSQQNPPSIAMSHTAETVTPQVTCNSISDESSASSAAADIKGEAAVTQRPRNPRNSASDKENKVPMRKPGRVTKPKDPYSCIQNAKLRGLMKGVKPRAPKRTDGPLLRMGQVAKGIQGYELASSSPPHGDTDAE